MANLINTLFPPIVSTFMPAFVKNESVKIFFSHSPYSNIDLKNIVVQVSVVRQDNNENALIDSTGILFYRKKRQDDTESINEILVDEVTDNLYIEISPSMIKSSEGNAFEENLFYKVQLRFDQNIYTSDQNIIFNPSSSSDAQLKKNMILTNAGNKNLFSEWSTVCLIKAIEPNKIILNWEDDMPTDEDGIYEFSSGVLPVVGSLKGMDGNSIEERLQSFQVLINNEQEENVYSSETFFPSPGSNEVVCYLDTENFSLPFERENIFTLNLKYTTKNLYTNITQYKFKKSLATLSEGYAPYDPTQGPKEAVKPKLDADKGVVYFSLRNDTALTGYFHIKRADYRRKNKEWETIKIISCTEANISNESNITEVFFQDDFACPLKHYVYSYQYENLKGVFSEVSKTLPVFVEANYPSLIRQEKQLMLPFNLNISNFKNTVSRTKVDTLGGKYPKFIENAGLNYKQFSLSGTISGEGDAYQLFLNKKRYYGTDGYDAYLEYCGDKEIKHQVRNDVDPNFMSNDEGSLPIMTTSEDWLWERDFREEVVAWLNDGQPKLFRSTTEGAIPVILTDVSLSPKTQLSRRLWDFSATAYQVGDEDSLADYIALGIFDFKDPRVKTYDDDNNNNNNNNDSNSKLIQEVGQLFGFTLEDKSYLESALNLDTNNLVEIIGQDLHQKKCLHNVLGGVNGSDHISKVVIKGVKLFFESPAHRYFFDQDGNVLHFHKEGPETPLTPESVRYTVLGRPITNIGVLKEGYNIRFQDVKVNEQNEQVNLQSLFINNRAYYEYPDNFGLSYLSLDHNLDKATVEYIVEYERSYTPVLDSLVSSKLVKKVVGQHQDVFSPGVSMGKNIRKKYDFYRIDTDAAKEIQQRMSHWKGISLEAPPYSCFNVLYKGQSNAVTYMIGATGTFSSMQNLPVEELSFNGRYFFKVDEDNVSPGGLREHECRIQKSNEALFERALNSNETQIYLGGQWWECQSTENSNAFLAKIPVSATVDYWGEIVETKKHIESLPLPIEE